MLNSHLQEIVLKATKAQVITSSKTIQTLWSGYGAIVRVRLAGAAHGSVITKYVVFPSENHHPRGWNTDNSHQRKVKSYDVEMHWYDNWSLKCDDNCRVAKCYAVQSLKDECVIIMEDLDAAGFPVRCSSLEKQDVKHCLDWLANFHATFMGEVPVGLWQTGTYWHLETRPDEFAAMGDGKLKRAAVAIDHLLNTCQYQTLVHGDAKVANFCFSDDRQKVAAVDFQYVGGGCGMKDVAYFLGSCLDEKQCALWQDELLDHYFASLKHALNYKNREIDCNAVENEWRKMFPVAWTDFYRFLAGWMPAHRKINEYTERLAEQVFASLDV